MFAGEAWIKEGFNMPTDLQAANALLDLARHDLLRKRHAEADYKLSQVATLLDRCIQAELRSDDEDFAADVFRAFETGIEPAVRNVEVGDMCQCSHCPLVFEAWRAPQGTIIYTVCEPCWTKARDAKPESPREWRARAIEAGNV